MKTRAYLWKNGICALAVFISLLVTSCDIKKNNKETDPKKDFVKIYENNDFSQSFIPIDVQQTSDGGFLVLAKRRIPDSQFYGVYILKTNELGDFVSEEKLESTYVNPIYNLMKVNGVLYFFAMNSIQEAVLMTVNEDGKTAEVTTVSSARYPLYASLDESTGQFVLLHYDIDDFKMIVSRITTAGSVTASRSFDIGVGGDFDIAEPLIDHLTGNGKRIPFFAGRINGGSYFFNGFYKTNLATLFFNFDNSAPGVMNGYRDERGLNALLPLSGNKFALSRFAYGDTYTAPNATLNTTGISGSSSIPANQIIEFSSNALVILKRMSINGRNVLVYNSDTKSKQICLYFYDESSGALLGARYFGYSNPYEAGNITTTSDGSIALVGTTYLAGRFPRIVLMKLNKDELNF